MLESLGKRASGYLPKVVSGKSSLRASQRKGSCGSYALNKHSSSPQGIMENPKEARQEEPQDPGPAFACRRPGLCCPETSWRGFSGVR